MNFNKYKSSSGLLEICTQNTTITTHTNVSARNIYTSKCSHWVYIQTWIRCTHEAKIIHARWAFSAFSMASYSPGVFWMSSTDSLACTEATHSESGTTHTHTHTHHLLTRVNNARYIHTQWTKGLNRLGWLANITMNSLFQMSTINIDPLSQSCPFLQRLLFLLSQTKWTWLTEHRLIFDIEDDDRLVWVLGDHNVLFI